MSLKRKKAHIHRGLEFDTPDELRELLQEGKIDPLDFDEVMMDEFGMDKYRAMFQDLAEADQDRADQERREERERLCFPEEDEKPSSIPSLTPDLLPDIAESGIGS